MFDNYKFHKFGNVSVCEEYLKDFKIVSVNVLKNKNGYFIAKSYAEKYLDKNKIKFIFSNTVKWFENERTTYYFTDDLEKSNNHYKES